MSATGPIEDAWRDFARTVLVGDDADSRERARFIFYAGAVAMKHALFSERPSADTIRLLKENLQQFDAELLTALVAMWPEGRPQ